MPFDEHNFNDPGSDDDGHDQSAIHDACVAITQTVHAIANMVGLCEVCLFRAVAATTLSQGYGLWYAYQSNRAETQDSAYDKLTADLEARFVDAVKEGLRETLSKAQVEKDERHRHEH